MYTQWIQPLNDRWNFTYLGINNNENIINDKEITFNGKPCKWNNVRKSINNYLSLMNINEDKLIGPFFIKPEDITDDRFDEVFKNKVLMYLFEDAGNKEEIDYSKQIKHLFFNLLRIMMKKNLTYLKMNYYEY